MEKLAVLTPGDSATTMQKGSSWKIHDMPLMSSCFLLCTSFIIWSANALRPVGDAASNSQPNILIIQRLFGIEVCHTPELLLLLECLT